NFHQNRKSLPMRSKRTLLPPLFVGTAIIVAGAMAQQTPPSPQPAAPPPAAKAPPPPKPPPPDAPATHLLNKAINAKRLDWVQTELWQQVDVQGLTFQARGSYLSAPDHRLHLDLTVHVAGTTGNLEVISDGMTLWETIRIGDGERTVTKKV